MHWLYLLIAIVLMLAATKVSGWLVLLFLLVGLLAFIAWMYGWVSSRISSGARSDMHILSPEDLRRLREQAEARKAASVSPPIDPQS